MFNQDKQEIISDQFEDLQDKLKLLNDEDYFDTGIKIQIMVFVGLVLILAFIYESINKHTNPLTKTEILSCLSRIQHIQISDSELQKQIIKYV